MRVAFVLWVGHESDQKTQKWAFCGGFLRVTVKKIILVLKKYKILHIFYEKSSSNERVVLFYVHFSSFFISPGVE